MITVPALPEGRVLPVLRAPHEVLSQRCAEVDPADPNDDLWVDRQLTGVAPSTCAGRSAIALSFADISALTPTGIVDVTVGSPVRIYEEMRLESFTTAGQRERLHALAVW